MNAEIIEHELPIQIRASNYLLAREYFKLGELLDIPPDKALDFCREMRSIADSIAWQIKLYPDNAETFRDRLEANRLRILEAVFKEAQKHE